MITFIFWRQLDLPEEIAFEKCFGKWDRLNCLYHMSQTICRYIMVSVSFKIVKIECMI